MDDSMRDEFADVGYEFADPPSQPAFEGWHRPRKQFVRIKQWIACARDLLDPRPVNEPLRYFGLPGTDLLDVRALYMSLCAPTGRELLFRGHAHEIAFDADAATRLEITLQQLKQLPGVDANSDVKGDPVEACASRRSVAYQDTARYGPYDIINLDLCDGFFGRSPGSNSLYSAVENLLALQARRTRPWLLFISGVVDQGAVHNDVREILEQLIADAAANCPELVDELGSLIDSDGTTAPLAALDAQDFALVANFALLAWLTERAQDGHPNAVALRSAFGYKTLPQAPAPDFYSLAFRFTPLIGPVNSDQSGLSSAGAVSPVEPCNAHASAAKRLGSAVDVDERLRSNNDLRDEMIQESMTLLEWARFDPDRYLQWVDGYES